MSMTTRWPKLVAATGAFAMAALSLAACGGGSSPTESASQPVENDNAASEQPADPAPGEEAAPGAQTEITWWSWDPPETTVATYIEAFNQEYPDIKVTFKRYAAGDYDAALRSAMAAGTAPDIYSVAASATLHPASVFGGSGIDLAPALEAALGADWRDQLSATAVADFLTVDGKFIGMSVGAVYAGNLWINQDLFDRYGLTAPTTYEEWKNVCATFESNGVGCFVQGAGSPAFNIDTLHAIADNIQPGLFADACGGKAQWTDPALVRALELWKGLFDDGIMQEGALGLQQYPDGNNAFLAGDYAMVMMGTWYAQDLIEAAELAAIEAAGVSDPQPFGLVPIPFPDISGSGRSGSMFGDIGQALVVNSASVNQDAATKFAVWLGTSQAGNQIIANSLASVPPLKGVEPDWDSLTLSHPDVERPALTELLTAAGNSTGFRLSGIPAEVNEAIQLASTQVASGEVTPAQAAENLQTATDAAGQ